MRWLGKWLRRLVLGVLLVVAVLLSPVIWIETACRGQAAGSDYVPIVTDPVHHRAEARTFLTYPEWHIVHAYDDYARVIRDRDPHDYAFLRAIVGFWTSLCAMSEKAASHGGFNWESKQLVYTIGVSFTAEFAMKALYEESIGRVATWVRGQEHSPLDDLSARQAADYAEFLQQVPWYKWDFMRDVQALNAANQGSARDRERKYSLGLEYRVKSTYAKAIAAAVAAVGPDALTLRMIVSGMSKDQLSEFDGVVVIGERPEGFEIETPRYRILSHLLDGLAHGGAEFVEIAGNDDIMLTATSSEPLEDALFSMKRQGYDDFRHLIAVKVSELAMTLRSFDDSAIQLEHIHDY